MTTCTFYRVDGNNSATALPGQECLTIDSSFYLAFVAGWCYKNVEQTLVPAVNCFDIQSGLHYGQFVDYFASEGGIVLSADLKQDFASLGYNNAPASGQGSEGSIPASAQTPIDNLLTDCLSLHSASLCAFDDISTACPCACDGACDSADTALSPETKSSAATYYAQMHLVIPIKQGYQFVLSTNPNVTQIWTSPTAVSFPHLSPSPPPPSSGVFMLSTLKAFAFRP